MYSINVCWISLSGLGVIASTTKRLVPTAEKLWWGTPVKEVSSSTDISPYRNSSKKKKKVLCCVLGTARAELY